MVSVNLDNGRHLWEPGDNVGVVVQWKWPSAASAIEAVEPDDFDRIAAVIAKGNFRANIQAKDWVGKAVAEILSLDLENKDDRARVKLMISGWIEAGRILVVKRRCPDKREEKDYIDVAELPHPEQGGAGKVLH